MKSFYSPPAAFKIFTEPFTFIDCEAAPEFVESWREPDNGPHRRAVTVRRLGRRPEDFIFDNGFDRLPDLCLYRLSGALMYHSLSFSRAGGVFPPSLRYRQTGQVTGFSLPRPVNPRPLGGGYFAYLTRPGDRRVKYVDEPAMPFYTFHEYGHYLMESLPSLHFLKIRPDLKLILPAETGPAVPAWLLDMVAPFGLDERSFIISGELSVFRDFYLPGRLYMEARYINSPAAGIYARVGRHYDDGRSGRPEKIYLSRRAVANRPLVNEDECEKLFRDRGFTVVQPERLPFGRQVRLLARASHVAGPVGTALHNAVFARRPEKLKLLMLVPEGLVVAKNFYQIESSFGRTPTAVFGRYLDPEAPRDIRLTFYSPWRLDPDELAAALDQWLAE